MRPLVDGGITPAIVNAIAGPYDSADEHELVLLVGLVALIRLAWASGVTAKYLCEERGLNVLSDVMAALQDRPDVADRASHLAWILCSQRTSRHVPSQPPQGRQGARAYPPACGRCRRSA